MTVKYETPSDHVGLITLNRPEKLNAVNGDMRRDLLDVTRRISQDDTIRAVVLTGAGRAFCAGADIADARDAYNVEDILNTEYGGFLSVIMTCPKPVIAAINGPAAGIGVSLALTCDLRVMAEDAYLMSAFANIGLVPDGGLSWILTREIGYARAYQLAIEAEKIDAKRCLEWGLVNRAVAADETLDNALEWAASLIDRAPISIALTKRAFRAAANQSLRDAMAYEAMLQRTAMNTEDFAEGVAARLQKRAPKFKGR
ncbi:MAG: enoyl-CoA hydratase/isomerase family protein [Parvularculaceae bacterium]